MSTLSVSISALFTKGAKTVQTPCILTRKFWQNSEKLSKFSGMKNQKKRKIVSNVSGVTKVLFEPTLMKKKL